MVRSLPLQHGKRTSQHGLPTLRTTVGSHSGSVFRSLHPELPRNPQNPPKLMSNLVSERLGLRLPSRLFAQLRSGAFALLASTLSTTAFAAVGGGWTNAGLSGDYFNNTTFTAPPSFSRKDVRLD